MPPGKFPGCGFRLEVAPGSHFESRIAKQHQADGISCDAADRDLPQATSASPSAASGGADAQVESPLQVARAGYGEQRWGLMS